MAEHVSGGAGATAQTIQQVIQRGSRRVVTVGERFTLVEIIAAILTALGLAALVIKAITQGFDDLSDWGFTAFTFGFLLSSVMAAPVLAVLLRLTRSDWRRPLTRIAELSGVAGIALIPLFIPLLLSMPSSDGRLTIWTIWPWGAPNFFDAIFVLLTVVGALAFLYVSAMPDFAIARDQLDGKNGRGRWYRRLARDWRGTVRQWAVFRRGLGVLGVVYTFIYLGTVNILFMDFGLSLVPGWRSAVFPAFASLSALQTGLCVVIIMMYALRRWGGLADFLEWEYFWSISKVLLAASLLWVWLWFSELIVFWYGRTPSEINVLELVMFQTYLIPFLLTLSLNFLAPLFILMWNRVRKSVLGPTIVAVLIMIGTFFDRFRIFGAAYTTDDPYAHELDGVAPGIMTPDILDILIVVGGLASAVFLIMLAMRFVPLPSIWEVGSGLPLKVRRRYFDTEVTVIAKPD